MENAGCADIALGRGTLYAPDYSNFVDGCDGCGKMLSQVRGKQPLPCLFCSVTHYCDFNCYLAHKAMGHRAQCFAAMDAEIDISGTKCPTAPQALWDLRKFTTRWHDQLADAAIAGLNLHADPSAMDRLTLIIHLSYVPLQPRRLLRFRVRSATVEPLAALADTHLHPSLVRRAEHSTTNRANGMMGCTLIVLACLVPGVGFVFNSTFVGPEPSVLVDPPPLDWLERLACVVDGGRNEALAS